MIKRLLIGLVLVVTVIALSAFTLGRSSAGATHDYQIVSHTATVNPGTFVSARCPSGLVVLGGGASVNSRTIETWISESFPANNGWEVLYNSMVSSPLAVTVWAVCGKVV
jgi:hypothetical protein